MSTLRAGDREFHTLPEGHVLTVVAAAASTGVVRQYPNSGFDAVSSTAVGVAATVTVGPFTGAVRLGIECAVGSVDWMAGEPAAVSDWSAAQRAAGQALVSGAWNYSAITTVGDSRLAQAFFNQSQVETRFTGHNFLPVARALFRGRLQFNRQRSFALSGLKSREYTASTYTTPALATNSYWLLTGGVLNDIAATANDVDYWTVYILPFVQAWMATGRGVILMTETGASNMVGTAAAVLAVNRYNRAVRAFAAANGNVLIFDAAKISRDPAATVGPRSSHSGDGTHINLYDGALAQAQELVSLLDARLPRFDPLPVSVGEVYANGGWQWVPNPLWTTTSGGTGGTGITGTIPSSIGSWGGDSGIVSIAVSTAAGAYGNDLVLTCTASAAGYRGYQIDLSAIATESPGDIFSAVCEVSIDSGHTNLAGLPWTHVDSQRGGVSYYSASCESADNLHGAISGGLAIGPVLLDSGPLVIQSGTRGWLLVLLRLRFSAAGGAVIRVRRVGCIRA